jgi:catechol 2,3-dioxygenase
MDATAQRLPATTRLGAVELGVADLGRSERWWVDAIGLQVQGRGPHELDLGTGGETLIRLVEQPGAHPAPTRTGLFHVALLLPRREDLAAWTARAIRAQVPVDGASDHVVSEALYLADPDGHGLEVYADRPRASWEGHVDRMATLPLDIEDLLSAAEPDAEGSPPEGTTIGHVHLRVAAIPEAIAFYRDVLGFELMTAYGPQAAFLAAGGYHHHIGANTWQSGGGSPPAADEAAMRRFTIVLPDAAALGEAVERVRASGTPIAEEEAGWLVRDPSGIAFSLTA